MTTPTEHEIIEMASDYADEQNDCWNNDYYGFIAGFEKAMSLFDINKQSELLNEFGKFITSDTANLNYDYEKWTEMFIASKSIKPTS